MKRLTILYREYLERGKCNYYNTKYEYFYCIDYTDRQINNQLEELNKNKRSRLYQIYIDFNLKTKKEKKDFINFFLENYNQTYQIKKLKSEVISIIEEWR